MSAMEMFSHENYSPYIWGILIFICMRGMYANYKEKEWLWFTSFAVSFVISIFMTLVSADIIHLS